MTNLRGCLNRIQQNCRISKLSLERIFKAKEEADKEQEEVENYKAEAIKYSSKNLK